MIDGVAYDSATDTCNYTNATCGKDNNWLDKGQWYWSMSPYSVDSQGAFVVNFNGAASHHGVYRSNAVRPALYLNSEVLLTGGKALMLQTHIQ